MASHLVNFCKHNQTGFSKFKDKRPKKHDTLTTMEAELVKNVQKGVETIKKVPPLRT